MTKVTTTFAPTSKQLTSYDDLPDYGGGNITEGSPIGLLLSLTQAETSEAPTLTSYDDSSKNTTSYGSLLDLPDATHLDSSSVTLDSSSVYLIGLLTPTNPLRLTTTAYTANSKPTSTYTALNKPSTAFTASSKPTTGFSGVNKPSTSFSPVDKLSASYRGRVEDNYLMTEDGNYITDELGNRLTFESYVPFDTGYNKVNKPLTNYG